MSGRIRSLVKLNVYYMSLGRWCLCGQNWGYYDALILRSSQGDVLLRRWNYFMLWVSWLGYEWSWM